MLFLLSFWGSVASVLFPIHQDSSKVSKGLDCRLVSNKNFSKLLPSNIWRPRPGKVGQGGLKVLHLCRHSQIIRTLNQKIFFECRREDLLGLLMLQPGPEHLPNGRNSRTKPRAFRCIFRKSPKASDAKVLNTAWLKWPGTSARPNLAPTRFKTTLRTFALWWHSKGKHISHFIAKTFITEMVVPNCPIPPVTGCQVTIIPAHKFVSVLAELNHNSS